VDTNGFAAAFVRVGKRVLANEAECFRYVEKANAKPSKPRAPRRPGFKVNLSPILDSDESA
jgi:hypothetical protein